MAEACRESIAIEGEILVVNGAGFDVVNFEAKSSANGEAELLVKIKGKEMFTALSSS